MATATTLRERILADLADRRGIPDDLERGDDWKDARARVDAMIAEEAKRIEAEVVAKIVADLRREAKAAEQAGLPTSSVVALMRAADRYESGEWWGR